MIRIFAVGPVLRRWSWVAVLAVGCGDPSWQSLESGSGSFQVSGGPSLYWRALGSGPDTVVVLHGGVGLHHGYLLEPLAALAPGRTLIFYDMRGRGRSSAVTDSTALTFDLDIADLESLRQHFKLQRVTLIGHHWGAAVAALYAARHPDLVERLLLVSPFPAHHSLLHEITFTMGDTLHYHEALRLAAGRSSPDTVAVRCRETWSLSFSPWRTDTATPYEHLAAGMCDAPAEGLARGDWVRTQVQRSLGSWVWRPELNALAVPTLVIEGDGTPAVTESATRWAQHLPNARVVLLPPPYLFPWVGSPARFRAAADAFLAGDYPDGAVDPPDWRP